MHPVYRQLIAVAFCLVTLMITCNKCRQRQAYQAAQSSWSPELERQLYDVFYTQSAGYHIDEEARKQYADCCVSTIKKQFPDGIGNIQNEMTDSVKIAMMKMGVECAKLFQNHINVWQPELIRQFKLQLYSYPEVKMLPVIMRDEYVECMAFEIRTDLPNGIEGKPKDTMKKAIEKARKHCLKLVFNKYNKTQKRLK